MNRKLIVSLICIIFLGIMINTYGVAAEYKTKYGFNLICHASNSENLKKNLNEIISAQNFDFIEVVDQQQTSSCGLGCPFFNYLWLGQGFIPSLNTLTKLEVKLFKGGNPTSPIIISIRDSLSGSDLTSASIDGSLVTQYGQWLEFDFPDLSVLPGSQYYIICRSSGGSMINYYCAEFDINNPYSGGQAWGSINYGSSWELIENYYPEYPDPDACFKIYGLDETPYIPTISGPNTGKPAIEYDFTLNSVDPDGDDVRFHIDWGDGDIETTSFTTSGSDLTVSHMWANQGTYTIKVYAEDEYGADSDEVTSQMIIEKSKTMNNPILNWLQSHPNIFPILQLLIYRFGLQ